MVIYPWLFEDTTSHFNANDIIFISIAGITVASGVAAGMYIIIRSRRMRNSSSNGISWQPQNPQQPSGYPLNQDYLLQQQHRQTSAVLLSGKKKALAGMIIGIISLTFPLISYLIVHFFFPINYDHNLLSVAAFISGIGSAAAAFSLILCVIGMKELRLARQPTGVAITGLVCSIIGLVFCLSCTACYADVFTLPFDYTSKIIFISTVGIVVSLGVATFMYFVFRLRKMRNSLENSADRQPPVALLSGEKNAITGTILSIMSLFFPFISQYFYMNAYWKVYDFIHYYRDIHSFTAIFNITGFVAAALGLICITISMKELKLAGQPVGMVVTGLVCSIVGLLLCFSYTALSVFAIIRNTM